MKEKITKIEANNELSRIKNLVKEKREDEARKISLDLSKRLYSNENEDNQYFNREGINIISKYFVNLCSIEEINVDYLIENIEDLGKENLKDTIIVDIIEKFKSLE